MNSCISHMISWIFFFLTGKECNSDWRDLLSTRDVCVISQLCRSGQVWRLSKGCPFTRIPRQWSPTAWTCHATASAKSRGMGRTYYKLVRKFAYFFLVSQHCSHRVPISNVWWQLSFASYFWKNKALYYLNFWDEYFSRFSKLFPSTSPPYFSDIRRKLWQA